MPGARPESEPEAEAPGIFPETRWTLITRARQEGRAAEQALETLCRLYWRPLYLYARHKGHAAEDAEDLTQGFFEKAIRSRLFQGADSGRGRLRMLLLAAFQRHAASEWRRQTRQKRGGGLLPDSGEETGEWLNEAGSLSPEEAYDRAWITGVMRRIDLEIERDYASRGRGEIYRHLRPLIEWYAADGERTPAIAAACGLKEGAVRAALYRLRAVYRRRLEECVQQTVEDPTDLEDEIRYLLRLLGKEGIYEREPEG